MAQDTSNVKYLATFAGADGAQREFQIIDNSGEWVTQQIVLTALALDEDNSEEIFEPMRIWSGSVSFYSDGITLEDLTPQTSQSLIVKIVRGEDTEFIGYLQGESLSQSYGQHGEVLSFTVASRLSVGSGLEYKEELSCSADNILTLGQLLYDCLKQCGAEDTDAIYLCDSVLLTAEADSPWKLFAAVVDRYRFYKENNDKTINEDYTKDDVSTIVAEILRPFGLMMHEQGANFVITHTNISISTTYRMLFISQLKDITEANTTGETNTPMTVHFVDGSVLHDTDQRADYYRGSKKFRVTLNLGLQEVDVFKNLLDFDLYTRNVSAMRYWGKTGVSDEPVDYISYFDPINTKYSNVRCYPYRLQEDAGSSEGVRFVQAEDLSTWADDQRPGCTPIAFRGLPNPSQSLTAFEPIPERADWKKGFIVNPSQYQRPDSSNKNKVYIAGLPLISVTTQKGFLLYGGKFVLSMSVSHHRYPTDGGAKQTNPSKDSFFLGQRFTIGSMYYGNYDYEASTITWGTTNNITALYITGGSGSDAQLEEETMFQAPQTPNWFFPGTFPLPTVAGKNKLLRGKISWGLYLGGPFLNYSDPNNPEAPKSIVFPLKTAGVILSGLSLSYDGQRDKPFLDTKNKDTRDYYKNSDNGFDGEEKRVTTLFGSYAEGGGSALSNMFYNNEPITTIYNGVSDIVIEEALVQQLKKYYDRICEIRTITIKDDATKYYAGDIIAMEDGEFLTLAVSVDYLNGVRKLTVTKIITA